MKRLNTPPQLLNKTKIYSQKGFTLVEIMIVLGIGTAIIALALIVVPTVLRNQRDTARTNAASIVLTQINNWSMRRNSKVPENLNDLRAALSNTTLPYYGKADDIDVKFLPINSPFQRVNNDFKIIFAAKGNASMGQIDINDNTVKENEIHVITKTVCKPGGYNIQKNVNLSIGYGHLGGNLNAGNSRTFAIFYALEGDKNIQCIDSN